MSDAEPRRPQKRRRWIALAGSIVAIILAIVIARSARHKQEAGRVERPQPAVPIEAASAHPGDIGVYVEALGTVTPVYTVTVMSRVQGQIVAVHYKEGQILKKGDPLIDIDSGPYEAALVQAQGQLARDMALLAEARIDLRRYRAAYARNAIPKQQLDDQEQLVRQSQGTVVYDQGTLQSAQVNLAYCHITSPIDGRAGLRLVDPGNIVQSNSTTPLVVLAQIQPITVIFSVPEDRLPEIQEQLRKPGAAGAQKMTVEVFDRTGEKKLAAGIFETLDNQVDPTTGTVRVRASFENKDEALFPNQFVNARLLVTRERGQLLVSTSAIQRNEQGAFVYVITPQDTATLRPVKTGASEGGVTVVQGVNTGEVVATDGFDKLREGSKVRIQNARQQAGTAGAGQPP